MTALPYRLLERFSARVGDGEAPRPTSPALRRRVTLVGAHKPLVLEPRQRLVDGAECEVALRETDDLLVDGDAVCRVADTQDREEDDLFELAEHGRYLIDNVENMTTPGSPQD